MNGTDASASVTTALHALGVAIFAGVTVTAGVLLRWLIHRDDVYDMSNVHFANFLIGAGCLVGLGALLVVARTLVSIPKPPSTS